MQVQHDLTGRNVDRIDRLGKGKAVQHMGIINENDEWATPRQLLLQKVLHFKHKQVHTWLNSDLDYKRFNPTFDYSASFINHKFPNYYTIEDDALTRAWLYDGFLNPPYSKVREFMEKAIHEWNEHGIGLLILVFAKTDTAWYHDLIEPRRLDGSIIVEFQRGRIDFDEVDEVANTVWQANHKVWSVRYKFDEKLGYTNWKVTKSSPYGSMWIFLPPKQI
jgi:phage N-6-adenine-methyltransferase